MLLTETTPKEGQRCDSEEEQIHLAKRDDIAWCGKTIGRWVTMQEWSEHSCKCCVREAMNK